MSDLDVWSAYKRPGKANGFCIMECGNKISHQNYHRGHVIARAKKGSMTIDNMRPMCQRCNTSMGTQNAIEFKKKWNMYSESLIVQRYPYILFGLQYYTFENRQPIETSETQRNVYSSGVKMYHINVILGKSNKDIKNFELIKPLTELCNFFERIDDDKLTTITDNKQFELTYQQNQLIIKYRSNQNTETVILEQRVHDKIHIEKIAFQLHNIKKNDRMIIDDDF